MSHVPSGPTQNGGPDHLATTLRALLADVPPHTILVADDEAGIRETLRDLLVEEGYRVITAVDGRQALHRLQSTRVDLVLLDMMMPALTGEEVITTMREGPEHQGVPVVLFSAGGCQDIADRYGVPCVRKPFDFDELLGVIARELRAPGATAP